MTNAYKSPHLLNLANLLLQLTLLDLLLSGAGPAVLDALLHVVLVVHAAFVQLDGLQRASMTHTQAASHTASHTLDHTILLSAIQQLQNSQKRRGLLFQ